MSTEFKLIPLAEIHPDPHQPRKFYDEAAMAELTESVKAKGVLQPIVVRRGDYELTDSKLKETYLLVCGERRYRASQAAGLTEIPAVIRQLSDDEALELQIIENLQRKDVHPMEEAVAFKSLLDHKQYTINEIALRVGKKEFYVKQRLKLNELTKDWQSLFYRNAITLFGAMQICLLPEKAQTEFYKNNVDKDRADKPGYRLEINQYRIDQYKGDLHKATFDLADATLDRKMGACTSCQYNTSFSALFPDAANSPRCMNIACFKHKSDVHFDKALKEAIDDPAVVLVHDCYQETDLMKRLKKQAHTLLKEYTDYSEVKSPEKPDWEEFREDYDEDEPEEELRAEFEKQMAAYEKDLAEYQKKIATGRYKKAFVVEDNFSDKGKYIYIELKKNAAQKNGKAAVETGEADVADIDAEISRIKDREKRAKELDAEKVWAKVKDILDKSTTYTADNRDCRLVPAEIAASAVALWEAGSMDYKKWWKKRLKLDAASYYNIKPSEVEKIAGLTEFGLNELLWHFIKDKLMTGYGSHETDGKAFAIYQITHHYHFSELTEAEQAQEQTANKRVMRVNSRISELQAKKKELKKSKPVKA